MLSRGSRHMSYTATRPLGEKRSSRSTPVTERADQTLWYLTSTIDSKFREREKREQTERPAVFRRTEIPGRPACPQFFPDIGSNVYVQDDRRRLGPHQR